MWKARLRIFPAFVIRRTAVNMEVNFNLSEHGLQRVNEMFYTSLFVRVPYSNDPFYGSDRNTCNSVKLPKNGKK